MSKQIYIVAGVLLIILAAVTTFFFVSQKSQTKVSSPLPKEMPEVTKPAEEALAIYEDEAGFEFSYPQSLKVENLLSEDITIYSLLKISSASQAGEIIIKVADTSFADLGAWSKSIEASGAGQSREITLSAMKGKQIQFPDSPRLVSIVIQDKILYQIQSPLDGQDLTSGKQGFWNKVHNQILSSFKFSGENQSSTSGSTGAEDVYVEEEVIE